MESYIEQVLALTIKSPDFNEMNLSEKEFGALIKSCEKIIAEIYETGGDDLLDDFVDCLREKDEYQPALQLIESLLYDE